MKAGSLSPHNAPDWIELLQKKTTKTGVFGRGRETSEILSSVNKVGFKSLRRRYLFIRK